MIVGLPETGSIATMASTPTIENVFDVRVWALSDSYRENPNETFLRGRTYERNAGLKPERGVEVALAERSPWKNNVFRVAETATPLVS